MPATARRASRPRVGRRGSWPEFLSVVSSFTDERDALQGCVERAAAAIGTEVAAPLPAEEISAYLAAGAAAR